MSSAIVPASQNTKDSGIVPHTTFDGTCVTALENRLLSDLDSWASSFTSNSANFPGDGVQQLLFDVDTARQPSVVWPTVLPGQESDVVVDNLRLSVANTAQTEWPAAVVGTGPQPLPHHQSQRLSTDSSLVSDSMAEVCSPSLPSPSQQFGSDNRPLPRSSGSAVDAVLSVRGSEGGQSSAKRRSLDHYPAVGHHTSSSGVGLAQMPVKQRANSLQNNNSAAQNVAMNSFDQHSSNVQVDRGGDYSFVAPQQRVKQQQHLSTGSGRLTAVEPVCRRVSTSDKVSVKTEPGVTKHVTFTDSLVCDLVIFCALYTCTALILFCE